MDGMALIFLGLIVCAAFSILTIIHEDFCIFISVGMFITTIGAIKLGKDEGLI